MITNNELKISNESYTKKDFYQIFPEIMDIVKSISSRWDPSTSNESDPGVVLLKLLAFIADKNNYNIDKAILEAFMPSATQEQSMRELCARMAYEMKYYKSAQTDVTFQYQGTAFEENETLESFTLPAFSTTLTNEDESINFVLLENVVFTKKYDKSTVPAIEGTLCTVTSGDTDIITLKDLDDEYRLFLPEQMIAQNGVWVKNSDDIDSSWLNSKWTRVNNIYTQRLDTNEKYCYKFGYDSKRKLPYLQFPENIGELIGSGLQIQYVRTTGVNGNVSAADICKLSSSTSIQATEDISVSLENTDDTTVLLIKNISASTNGEDKETIDDAYNSFKKTVGTFDTLVSCRDYANAIYNLVTSSTDSTPLVSNVVTSDIRDDIQRSLQIVTFTEFGKTTITRSVKQDELDLISHFDLYYYPFTPISGDYTKVSYRSSFNPYFMNNEQIETSKEIKNYKTLSHTLKTPTNSDSNIYCIKNYGKLSARIATTYKVNNVEANEILKNIKNSLYKNFNMRRIDFGEEIPFDTILDVIENSDTRIKSVSLDEPELTPYIMFADGSEVAYGGQTGGSTYAANKNRKVYLDLLIKNILAGKVGLFNYDKSFKSGFNQAKLTNYDLIYGSALTPITSISTNLSIQEFDEEGYTLGENEVVQVMMPNLTTTQTYSSYINYYFKRNTADKAIALVPNEEHQLVDGEVLYINYTNSNDVSMNIEYGSNYIKTNGISKSVDFNIIRPNFALKDTATVRASTNKTWSKELDSTHIWYGLFQGMYATDSSQQIELRDFVEVDLSTVTKGYWNTRDGWLFHENESEIILQEGESFFYTDSAMSSLIILGTGTKLTRDVSDGINYYIDYSESKVSLDEVATTGLGAFASTDWRNLQYTSNKKLHIQEMQFINLIEGDTLVDVEFISGNSWPINSTTWKNVSSVTYRLKGDDASTTTSEISIPALSWKIKSRLDLNAGPELNQTLVGTSVTTQSITLNTTSGTLKTIQSTGTVEPTIKFNYLTQEPGNKVVINDTIVEAIGESFKVMVFSLVEPTYKEDTTEKVLPESDFTKIEFSSQDDVVLHCTIPTDDFGLLMIHYETPNETPLATAAYITSDVTDAMEFYNCDGLTGTKKLYLTPGLNTIKILKNCQLTIKKESSGANGSVIFDTLRLVNSANNGLSIKYLGLNSQPIDGSSTYEWDYILSQIKSLTTTHYTSPSTYDINTFYYSVSLSDSELIDSSDISSPYVLYDYNNIFNKFVITQLGINTKVVATDSLQYPDPFPDITIAKSSRA